MRAPNGVEAPLEEVATIELGQGYPTIKRSDRARIINVQTSADKVLANIPLIENDLDTNSSLLFAKNSQISDSLL